MSENSTSIPAKDPDEPQATSEDKERFWVKVDGKGTDGCWLWQAATDRDGYGVFKLGGRKWRAHRVAALLDGRDPTGKVVRHTCDNPSCVNPAHLVVGTQGENMRDMVRRGRHPRGRRNGQAKLDAEQVAGSGRATAPARPLPGSTASQPATSARSAAGAPGSMSISYRRRYYRRSLCNPIKPPNS